MTTYYRTTYEPNAVYRAVGAPWREANSGKMYVTGNRWIKSRKSWSTVGCCHRVEFIAECAAPTQEAAA